MRQRGAPSELVRLAAPLGRAFDGAWQRMHWWVALMVLLYAGSGVTVIRPDEVAVVERWGRLVGDSPATQVHGPGLLWALPRPVDRVIRVSTQRVSQLSITTLAAPKGYTGGDKTLDPLLVGYAVTGDENILHVAMRASYRVQDPVAWAFYGPASEAILRTEVTAAMVRSLGEMGVDEVLSSGRKNLIAKATERAQAGLDAAHSGLALVSLELLQLGPPGELAADFDRVQSAYIEAETGRSEAEAFAQNVVPGAQAEADREIQAARGDAATVLARARGSLRSFIALSREYQGNPEVVRERLYRDAVDAAISGAGQVRWIPPPAGSHDKGVRILIGPEVPTELPPMEESPAPAPTPSQQPCPAPSQSPEASPSSGPSEDDE